MASDRDDEYGSLPVVETPKLDIFAGRFGCMGVSWIETVEGLSAARNRMEEVAARKPGQYFVFCSFDQTILAFIDNSR